MKALHTPLLESVIDTLEVGDQIQLSGYIFTGRDAVLPKIAELARAGRLQEFGIDLRGSVIFHTAVSPAGVGPTSSNKLDIEGNIPYLSELGVKLHLGKGALKKETVEALQQHHAVYAVMPPVTALLESKTLEKRVVAFAEEGMEAFHALKVETFPAIIAAAKGESLYGAVR